jgi:hypothetical protein
MTGRRTPSAERTGANVVAVMALAEVEVDRSSSCELLQPPPPCHVGGGGVIMPALGDLRRAELTRRGRRWPTVALLKLLLEVLGPIGGAGIGGALLVIAVEAVRWVLP